MYKLMKVALALACVAAAGSLAQAADNGTEFGIEDDLTVLGTAGTALDPDVEIKGFTVFGSTQAAYLIPVDTGNVVLNGIVQVSSGLYVAGGSTFTAGAYFTGISSFSDAANIHVGGGTANQVLKKVAGGGMVWADDSLGAGEIAGTARRIVMFQADGTGGADSALQQDAGDTSITMISGSSLTINGPFQSTGTVKLGNATAGLGDVTIVGAATAQSTLGVDGDADMNARLNVDLSATFVSSVTAKGDTKFGDAVTDVHGVNMAPAADTALSVAGQSVSGDYAAKFYSGGSLAAWIKKK